MSNVGYTLFPTSIISHVFRNSGALGMTFLRLLKQSCRCDNKYEILCVVLLFNLLVGFFGLHSWKNSTFIRSESNNTGLWNSGSLPNAIFAPAVEYNPQHPQNRVITEPLFPYHYNYIILNRDFCRKGSLLILLILVCASTENFLQRQTVRETWGSVAALSNNTESVRVGFLLGKPSSSSLQEKIMKESAAHSDIIQGDFLDSYQNLTIKSVMLLKWTTMFCPNVRFVMKTDDDMYVNVAKLMKTFVKMPHASNSVYGVLFHEAPPIRDTSSKWFVPETQFQGKVYPDYLSGTGYVISRDAVPRLLEASYNLPFLVLEDIFITGLCAEKAGVKRVGMGGFDYERRTPTGCSFRNFITGHHVTPEEMRKIWSELQDASIVC